MARRGPPKKSSTAQKGNKNAKKDKRSAMPSSDVAARPVEEVLPSRRPSYLEAVKHGLPQRQSEPNHDQRDSDISQRESAVDMEGGPERDDDHERDFALRHTTVFIRPGN